MIVHSVIAVVICASSSSVHLVVQNFIHCNCPLDIFFLHLLDTIVAVFGKRDCCWIGYSLVQDMERHRSFG